MTMLKATQLILTFNNTHKVLKAEQILLKQGLKPDIIPTPKDLSSDCGMAIRLKTGQIPVTRLKKMMEDEMLAFRMHER